VGPLTRNGVSAVVDSALVIVPTLALNVPERTVSGQRDLYVLSLHAESEARQVAQLAWQDGRQNAITVKRDSPLLKRIHRASSRSSRGWVEKSSPNTPSAPSRRSSRA